MNTSRHGPLHIIPVLSECN